VALPKVNTKDLIKSKLPASTTNTLSVPKPTAELSNVETLNSKNLVGEGNTPLPETIKDQKIAEGVEKNTPGMAACIKEKIKDLAGVFTVPLGIPSFDQFKVPDINDAPNLSVKDAFRATFDDIKNTVKGTVNGIKEAFTFKKQQGLDQIETGGLSLKKFLGCEEMDVDFTPRERNEAAEKPEIITKKEEEGVKKSQVALAAQANENVKQRTEPPAEKSKQEDVPTNTQVEIIPPLKWNFYNLRIYATPGAEPLTPEIQQNLKDAGLSVISTEDKTAGELLLFAVKNINENSLNYLYEIVRTKDKNPEIALYDPVEYNKKQQAIKSLPAGYLIVTFNANNESYGLDDATLYYYSIVQFSMNAKYKGPGKKFYRQVYNDFRGATKFMSESSYTQADVDLITYYIAGETKPFGAKTPYFVTRLQNKQSDQISFEY